MKMRSLGGLTAQSPLKGIFINKTEISYNYNASNFATVLRHIATAYHEFAPITMQHHPNPKQLEVKLCHKESPHTLGKLYC